ncbi:MAG: sulfotransferase [Cytophagales bacterium]|nr:sulfotransferase [Cytophagales bacterium]
MNQKWKFGLPILALPICAISGLFRRKKYKNIHTFCCFIGYSRSGHTIVGSLLDAHPNIVISTEAHAFNLVKLGFGRIALLFYLEVWSKLISRLLGNKWTGYDYQVKGANQGVSGSISIIGDKKGNGTLTSITKHPELPKKIQRVVGLPVKYIHVIRNPYDIISTMHNRNPEIANTTDQGEATENRKFSRKILKKGLRSHFKKTARIQNFITQGEMEILNIYHEDLISSSEKTLKKVFDFLGAETDPEFLKRCADIIYENPNKSRHSIPWPKKLKAQVHKKCGQIPFLEHYSFDE